MLGIALVIVSLLAVSILIVGIFNLNENVKAVSFL